MSFKYLFVRYTEELHNMFCNEQLCFESAPFVENKVW